MLDYNLFAIGFEQINLDYGTRERIRDVLLRHYMDLRKISH